MLRTFKLIIEYDGTHYHGWQRQATDRTIQGEIEAALLTMTRQQVSVTGSGRTDAGVHALAQTASFRCDTRLTPDNFQQGLNSLLDDDIVIRDCQYAPDEFHARFDAQRKTYQYRILNRLLPPAIGRQYVWHIRRQLDIAAMRQALPHITGEHDFTSFEGAGSPQGSSVRNVMAAILHDAPDGHLYFDITANGFLKHMVRNIVGTLAEIGLNKLTPDDMGRILAARDRSLAGATAPPQGLFLMNVEYPDQSVP
ncbi:MAG: tRNA pseudouridine(38-40) synthase TruA [Thermodesulfobacteriota bacterium]